MGFQYIEADNTLTIDELKVLLFPFEPWKKSKKSIILLNESNWKKEIKELIDLWNDKFTIS